MVKKKEKCEQKLLRFFIILIVLIFARLPVWRIIFDNKASREDWSLGMKEAAFSLFRIFGHSI